VNQSEKLADAVDTRTPLHDEKRQLKAMSSPETNRSRGSEKETDNPLNGRSSLHEPTSQRRVTGSSLNQIEVRVVKIS